MTDKPVLTVCAGDVRHVFAPGREVVIGRDVRADLRIPDPLISRAHAILRCCEGQWVAVDNDSLNGMYVDAQRVPSLALRDGSSLHLGVPDGPRLAFQLGPPPDERPTVETTRPTRPITIGRAPDNDIGVSDVLASRHHARLIATPSGMQIQDAHSVNGTFVNGTRIKNATLVESDVVTIGNVDFVYAGGTLVRRREPAPTTGGLKVRDVSVTLESPNVTLLNKVSFDAAPGTLTAVIGPSGSGKSTLLKVLFGAWQPTGGVVSFDGHLLHAEYASLRGRIGMVPQDDVVHRGLTVNQALNIAAQLRMPPDTGEGERQQVISRVLSELGMAPQAQTRVDRLSGGQRKRVSVALELLTEPSLLMLDEPTTGLDPALDRQVMALLRELADAGRVIVVVTHSLAFLDMCDQVLLLAPGGKTAYLGPADDIGTAMGSSDWADIYHEISADPDAAQRRFVERRGPVSDPGRPTPGPPAPRSTSARTSHWRQFRAIARRQVQLLLASRRYLVFLVVAPFVVGLLPMAVGGDAGFNAPPAGSTAPFEPRQIVSLLGFAAILLGTTLTVRDLIAERATYRHEQAAGLSPSAYLLAKIVVFAAVAVLQSAVLVLVVTAPGLGKRAPSTASVLGIPVLELFVDVAATAVVAAILGLVVSSVSRSSDQYIPLLAVTCTAQLVLAGSFIPITGRPALEAFAALTPARWGFAATASTIDLTNLVPTVRDAHWLHTASAWWFDMAMLTALGLMFTGFVRWRLRRRNGVRSRVAPRRPM
ncbi:ATP-binding cassette domain-containing protein [Mycobacterium deserti]|uniref:ATP-binding cassette domain-containing protein n=1 Tax=Mycobacterium deserti TaxID=2978347 RepID=A0ABT2MFS3_9MYCO|nr:ATP-binding cassette domain-containing protein [Mycobacterium deserti]MCT7661128.1 ATP-binding cassette domain-containing protein [Mycobacterium deserti]